MAACAAVAATACTSDDHLPPIQESGGSGTGHSGQPPDEAEDGSNDEGDDSGEGADAGEESCAEQGGLCMSDTDDPTMPAFCEAMDLVEIEGACPDVDSACCAPSPAGLCEAAGGQCLANPSGGGTPLDCADLGLIDVAAPCASIDLTCCR